MTHYSPQEVSALRALAGRFPSAQAAVAEIAYLEAALVLPKTNVHVISDIHGDHQKLRHVLSNASGSLRPLVEEVFGERLGSDEKARLLNTIYYPEEMFQHLDLAQATPAVRAAFVRRTLRQQFEILARLSRHYSLMDVRAVFPPAYQAVFGELFLEHVAGRPPQYIDTMLDALSQRGKGLDAVRSASQVIQELSVSELVVAGDLGDRGPRLDKVIDLLISQPHVAMTWGNHDMSWMGASLGHEACIATVLRVSLRQRRLTQIEEGFGITLQPLEKLAREVYGQDPALRFQPRGCGLRETAQMARMQKAISVIQFKLEAQVIARHPEYAMQHRALIAALDLRRGTVCLEGREYPLADTALPTLESRDPTRLAPEEAACMERLRRSFLESETLGEQMRFVAKTGATYLIRDGHLIFHGCVPVDETGAFLPLEVDGALHRGRALFEAIEEGVRRAFRERRPEDLDRLWYLWTGPLSPMFGKDKMTTFEGYFIEDKRTHHETKNPYFRLIHTPEFCRRILEEFGVDPAGGLIVNGHVPVKVEAGERPLKASGMAITIDGAFSEAYGDRGYTLILSDDGTRLAQHHHFESVADALSQGTDIIPEVQQIRRYDPPRRVADTERGALIHGEIAMLTRLVEAYESNVIQEQFRRLAPDARRQ
jgi:fructose-1,6-bisphosphatase-3